MNIRVTEPMSPGLTEGLSLSGEDQGTPDTQHSPQHSKNTQSLLVQLRMRAQTSFPCLIKVTSGVFCFSEAAQASLVLKLGYRMQRNRLPEQRETEESLLTFMKLGPFTGTRYTGQ